MSLTDIVASRPVRDEVEARIERGPFAFDQDTLTIQMRRRYSGGFAYLMENGTWLARTDESLMNPDSMGIKVPAAALEALTIAIDSFLGRSSHHDTEVAILREWLAVEQSRNERLISALAASPQDS